MQLFSKPFVLPLTAFVAGVVILPLGVLVFAVSGLLSTDSTSAPPKWESTIGQMALQASLQRRAAGLHDPLKGGDAELAAGMKIYMNTCAGCHGDFRRRGWGATGLYPRAPQFGRDLPALTSEEIFATVKYGVRYSAMGANDGAMPDKDAWQVATFVSRLHALPRSVADVWTAKTPKR